MASMDISTTRKAPGISVFWMILGVAIGTGIILAVALVMTEGSSTPTTGTTDSTTEAVGPAVETQAVEGQPAIVTD